MPNVDFRAKKVFHLFPEETIKQTFNSFNSVRFFTIPIKNWGKSNIFNCIPG